jgi:hypothetical protein
MNLIEKSLGRNGASEKILQQRASVSLGAVAEQSLAEPRVPTWVAGVERAQSLADVLAHLGCQYGAESVVHHVTGGIGELYPQRPPRQFGMRDDMEIVVCDLGPEDIRIGRGGSQHPQFE